MKRKKLTNGFRWWRWVVLLTGWIVVAEIWHYFGWEWGFLSLSLSAGLFFLLWRSRRIAFDHENLYFIYGRDEKVVPLARVQSIKRSGMKVNGTRLWNVRFRKDNGKERLIRYKPPVRDNSKEFREAVQRANPSVVIWTNPHFNH